MTGQIKGFHFLNGIPIDSKGSMVEPLHPSDEPTDSRLARIRQRIRNGYYDSDHVMRDISDKLGNILGEYEN